MLRNDDGRPGRKMDTRLFVGSGEAGGGSRATWLRRGELNETLVLSVGESMACRGWYYGVVSTRSILEGETWPTGLAVRDLLRRTPASKLSTEPAYISTIEKTDSLYTRSSSLGSVTTIMGTAGTCVLRGGLGELGFATLPLRDPRMDGAVSPGLVGDEIPSDMAAKSRSCLLFAYG